MAEPFNYNIQVANPMQGFMSGVQGGLALRDIQEQRIAQQQQAEEQARMRQELEELSKAPTVSGIRSFMIRNPALSDKFKPLLEGMSAEKKQAGINKANNVFLAAQSGKIDLVRSLLQQDIDASKNSGEDSTGAETLLKTLDEDPNKVIAQTGLFLSQAMGPEQFEKTYGTLSKLPAEVRQAGAQATTAEVTAQNAGPMAAATLGKTQAEADKARIEAQFEQRKQLLDLGYKEEQIKDLQSQRNERVRRLALDEQKYDQTLMELVQKTANPSLDAENSKLVNESNQRAATSDQLANKAMDIATRLDNLNDYEWGKGGAGALSSANIWLRQQTGWENPIAEIQRQYLEFQQKGILTAMKSMGGSSSDKDVEFASKPYPKENTDPKVLARYLRGQAKIQKINAEYEAATAEWVSQNGGTRNATRDLNVRGVQIPKGTSFFDFQKQFIVKKGEQSFKEAEQDRVKDASYWKFAPQE